MMHKMRENTKVILWVVVVSFVVTIFAVWGLDLRTGNGSQDPNLIGKVNGVPITRSDYQFIYNQFMQQLRAQSQDQSITYAQEEFVRSQAWDNLVYGILTDQEIKKLGITVSDEEIVAYLRNNPPVEVRDYFLNEQGEFDMQRYLAELNNPANDWTALEALVRERIPRIKLNEYLQSQVAVSENEIFRNYELQSVDLSIRWVEFPFDDPGLEDYEPTDEEITRYYESHKEDFLEPEKARVRLVRIPLQPSTMDKEDALFTANRVRTQLADGEDFGVLAKTFSEAPTSFVEGATGFITRERRDEQYIAALDTLQPGELSGVIDTRSGYYIVRLDEKRVGDDGAPEYSAHEILVTAMASSQTSDSLFDMASQIRDDAANGGLDAAAMAHGLDVFEPAPFAEDGVIEDIGFASALNHFAFSSAPGTISDVLRDENNIYVALFVEKIPESYLPVESARTRLQNLVVEASKRSAAEIKAKAFFQKANSAGFESALQTYGRSATESGLFRGTDDLADFGPASAVAEAALSIAPNQTCPPVDWRRRFVCFELLSRSTVDPADYNAKMGAIRDRLRSQKAQLFVQSWYEQLKEESRIEDFRFQS